MADLGAAIGLTLLDHEESNRESRRKIRFLKMGNLVVSLACCCLIAVIIVGSILHAAEIDDIRSQRDRMQNEMIETSKRLEQALRTLNATRGGI